MSRMSLLSRVVAVGVATVVSGAVPLAAQSPESVMHAELGTLRTVGPSNEFITTTFEGVADEPVVRTYRTSRTTLVEGLGDIMQVSEIPQDAIGRVVVVQFVRVDGEERARTLQFPVEQDILVTSGIISRTDRSDEVIVLWNAEGAEEMALDFGYGAVIDSPAGLKSFSDLETGQEVVVYYAEPERAYLVFLSS